MRRAVVQLAVLLALPATAHARPTPDPLRPPADTLPKPPSRKQRAAAKAHYTRALAFYDKKRFEAARKELAFAIQLAPEPDLFYAIALVDKRLDRCEDELTELQKFLEAPHGRSATQAANSEIDRCKAKLSPPPAPPPPPPALVLKIAPRPTRHWYRDRLGDGMVAAGAASGLIGLLCYRSAVGDLDAADQATTLPAHAMHVDDAHRLRTYALVAAGTGLAFVAAGVVRYLTHDRDSEPNKTLALIPVAGGGVIGFSGTFQ